MRRPSWKSLLAFVVSILVVPATVVLGSIFQRSLYLVTGIVIVIVSMIPFFVLFERRKPQARELVTLSTLVALAVASRAAFAFLPQFKPMAAIIMICGMAFGPSFGFLAGSLSAFLSNFIFGQGPWTPWQMLSFGLCGYAFGLLCGHSRLPHQTWSLKARVLISLAGAAFIMLIAGPVLDTSTLFWMTSSITPQTIVAVYAAGFPMNAMHAVAVFVTLFFAASPMLDKISRLKTKFGFGEDYR